MWESEFNNNEINLNGKGTHIRLDRSSLMCMATPVSLADVYSGGVDLAPRSR